VVLNALRLTRLPVSAGLLAMDAAQPARSTPCPPSMS